MKSILKPLAVMVVLIMGFSFSSCKLDKCKSVICAEFGECQDDGSCVCAPGYEGERCETATRDKFKGVWNVVEDGSISSPQVYAVSVSNASEINQVYIQNFNNFANAEVRASVEGDTIYIYPQTVEQDGVIKTVEGKGYVVPESYYDLHGRMILKYRVTDKDGLVNNFGYKGVGTPSEWTK